MDSGARDTFGGAEQTLADEGGGEVADEVLVWLGESVGSKEARASFLLA